MILLEDEDGAPYPDHVQQVARDAERLATLRRLVREWRESYNVDPLPPHWDVTARIEEFEAVLGE